VIVVVEFCLLLLDGLLKVRTPAFEIREFALGLFEVCELGFDFLALAQEPPKHLGVDRMHDDRRRAYESRSCRVLLFVGAYVSRDPNSESPKVRTRRPLGDGWWSRGARPGSRSTGVSNEFGTCPVDDDGLGPCSDPQRFVSSHERYEHGVHYTREYGNVGLAYLPGLYELRVD